MHLLVERILDGEQDIWPSFASQVHATVLSICRHRGFAVGIGDPEDAHRDVAQRVLERLRADDWARLRRYQHTASRYPQTKFIHWLAAVVSNVYIDYVRGLAEVQRKRVASARSLSKVVLISGDEVISRQARGDRTTMERAVDVRRILALIASPDFPEAQRQALVLWLRGHEAKEIARALDLPSRREANNVLRAARERLRRAVRGDNKA